MENRPFIQMPDNSASSGASDIQSDYVNGDHSDVFPLVSVEGESDGASLRTFRALRQSTILLETNRILLSRLGTLNAAVSLATNAGIDLSHTIIKDVLDPEYVYKLATEIIKRDPDLLPAVLSWRWEMELRRGIVNFDPRDPEAYKQVKIGSYLKRIIPDRVKPDTEVFSQAVPVYLPFEQKYPSNFDFTMAKPGQNLLNIEIDGNSFDIFASNSPLASVPHTLLVPTEQRSQFLKPSDIDAVSKLREDYPMFHFVFSSMGAGAGVNHQHWHIMAGQAGYPIHSRPITMIHEGEKAKIGHYPEWPTDCLVIESSDGYEMEVEKEFVKYLQQNNMPHNLFVDGKRTWIAPRSDTGTTLIPGKKYGAWEIILGVCNTNGLDQYNFVNENILIQALRAIQLSPEVKAKNIQELITLV